MPHHFSHPPFFAAVLAAVGCAAFSGCATTRTINVEASNNPAANTGYSYIIDASNLTGPGHDGRAAEIIDRVRLALSQRGMFESPDPARADVVVRVDYGERAAHTEVETVSEPVIVQPSVIGPSIAGSGVTLGQPGIYPGSYPSNQPQVVMAQSTRVTRVSEKYIRISARENVNPRDRSHRPAQEVWIVEATIEDESADVGNVIPSMIDAATDYIGLSTAGPEKVTVNVEPR